MTAAHKLPFQIDFSRHPAGLRVYVAGENTLENTLAYWHAIVEQVRRHHPRGVMLVDEMHGPPLRAEDWKHLVDAIPHAVMGPVHVAHVRPKGAGLRALEYCEIFAREAGFDARVFTTEHEADVWLRYGERSTEP